LRYKAYTDGDEGDAGPAFERNGFMEPEAGEEGDDYIAECGCGENEREISPRKRS